MKLNCVLLIGIKWDFFSPEIQVLKECKLKEELWKNLEVMEERAILLGDHFNLKKKLKGNAQGVPVAVLFFSLRVSISSHAFQ